MYIPRINSPNNFCYPLPRTSVHLLSLYICVSPDCVRVGALACVLCVPVLYVSMCWRSYMWCRQREGSSCFATLTIYLNKCLLCPSWLVWGIALLGWWWVGINGLAWLVCVRVGFFKVKPLRLLGLFKVSWWRFGWCVGCVGWLVVESGDMWVMACLCLGWMLSVSL